MAHHSPRFLQIVEAVRVNIRECSVSDVRERQARGESFLLFDVREESEFAAGHLPGAKSLGKGIIERDIESLVPDPDTEMVLYCGGGFPFGTRGRQPAEDGLHQRHQHGRRLPRLERGRFANREMKAVSVATTSSELCVPSAERRDYSSLVAPPTRRIYDEALVRDVGRCFGPLVGCPPSRKCGFKTNPKRERGRFHAGQFARSRFELVLGF